ncbi:hypothetical protein [Flavobacterium collinsii]|jgi:hypothetical protein|uniref:Uncharacterized protein n=1 Tax=Flavobacterium collinsii TaxID=1114861 RepID=A0A9W4X3R7_9FLAO|nr:hypothetical protein [Flavobacterium collinsii]CAA9203401.1 hypothetical protein FLACOL7796_04727 [Flavobacterium collinsii]CAI2767616.1 conserved protein of unknown function [Flavobacterium collinsii]
MGQERKKLTIICNYEDFLKDSINWYNSTYKTDFLFVGYVDHKLNLVEIEFVNADVNQIFDLGRIYGGTVEAFDKKISNQRSIL